MYSAAPTTHHCKLTPTGNEKQHITRITDTGSGVLVGMFKTLIFHDAEVKAMDREFSSLRTIILKEKNTTTTTPPHPEGLRGFLCIAD